MQPQKMPSALNESTFGADASVLCSLMHTCTCMCIHIIWAWWLQKSEGQSLCSVGVTDDRNTKIGHYVAMLAVVAW